MVEPLKAWWQRIASNAELSILLIILVLAVAATFLVAGILAPFIAAVIIAYVLQIGIAKLETWGVRPSIALTLVFLLFLAGFVGLVFGLLPLIIRQATQVASQAPELISGLQVQLMTLPDRYPALVTADQVTRVIEQLQAEVLAFTQAVVGSVGGTVVGLMTWIVYLIIVPLMVFFLVKDKEKVTKWATSFLPEKRDLARQVWDEVHSQLQNYVGGKVLEIAIVGFVTYVSFAFLGLQFALLLAVITGFSVLIPYIGAAVVTLPVAAVAILQWGFEVQAGYVLIAYGIIQALDGNLLVPFLFSEAVSIHPVAIIVAILFFGGIWGFWGVFFAIPLAVVVQAVLNAWPKGAKTETAVSDAQ